MLVRKNCILRKQESERSSSFSLPHPPPLMMPNDLLKSNDPLAALKNRKNQSQPKTGKQKNGMDLLNDRLRSIGIDPKKIKDFNEMEINISVKKPLEKIEKVNREKRSELIASLKQKIDEMRILKDEKNKPKEKIVVKSEPVTPKFVGVPPPPPPPSSDLFTNHGNRDLKVIKKVRDSANTNNPDIKDIQFQVDENTLKEKLSRMSSKKSIEDRIANNKKNNNEIPQRMSRREQFEQKFFEKNVPMTRKANSLTRYEEQNKNQVSELQKLLDKRRARSEGGGEKHIYR